MSKISVKRRKFEIKKKQKRKLKLRKLRELFGQAKSQEEKDKILEKAQKIAPHLSPKEFLLTLEEKSKKKEEDKNKQTEKE